MYDAGLPFNCVNHKSFDKFIEAVGQHGPEMKPPTFHEVRVTHLKKRGGESRKKLLMSIKCNEQSLDVPL